MRLPGNDPKPTRAVRIASGINAAVGLWMVPSPWVLSGAADALFATWVSVSAGASITVLALARAIWPAQGASMSVANLLISLLGALLIVAFADLATSVAWNGIVAMLIVALLAMRSALITAARATHEPRDRPLL